ncbi:MAG TPA: hypothetical protein VKU61_03220 [Candidatus Binatia bacterium]|nr:hypothetical protein [Candidatus Binatia bacterium]
MGRGTLVVTLLAATLVAGAASADNNPNGMAFRAVGWFKGKGSISNSNITCEIPTTTSAIADGSFAMGLWNTFGVPTLYFPDINGPFANPCGGWLELQNNLATQAIQIDHINLRYKIAGARRFRGSVPTRNQFPLACRGLRNDVSFVGAVVNPANGTDTSGSGAPNVTFIEVLPLVSPQLFNCLRSQYAGLPADLYSSLPLVIRAIVVGTSDAGDTYQSNGVSYTLNLRHTCGNGRVDDGEQCDPAASVNTCTEDMCTSGHCALSGAPCVGAFDCAGHCIPNNDPSECTCVY